MIDNKSLEIILRFEGGKANDPNDRGGKTNYGITQATYNSWLALHKQHDKDVFHITIEEVEQIYEEFYWESSKCDIIRNSDSIVATIHFDCAVNCGVGTASKMLQEVLGVTMDGVIGPKTLNSLAARCTNPEDRLKLRVAYLAKRLDYYIDITVARFDRTKFMPSWARRVHYLLNYSLE